MPKCAMFFVIAALALWASAAQAEDGFRMNGTYYSGCKAAESDAYKTGYPDPVYKAHCLQMKVLSRSNYSPDSTQPAEQPAQYAPQGADNWAEVGRRLQEYKKSGGELWHVQGPHLHSYTNRRPPPGAEARPCQPPGFDHVVLCVRRKID